MSALPARVLEPEEVLSDLLGLDPDLRLEPYYGERSIFYNPRGIAPLGVLVASVKEQDGPNDKASELWRPGVYRLCFCVRPETFVRRLGAPPPRTPKAVVEPGEHDPAALDTLAPHPVYGCMHWVQILSPTAASLEALRPLIDESLELARARWRRRDDAGDGERARVRSAGRHRCRRPRRGA